MENIINYNEGIVNDVRIDETGFKNIFRALPNSHQPMSQSYDDSQESINITINSILIDGKYFINNGSIVQLDMSEKIESIYYIRSFDTTISFEKEPYSVEKFKEIKAEKKYHVYALSKMTEDNIILYDTAIYGFNKSGELLGEGEIDVELTARVTSIEEAMSLFATQLKVIEEDIANHQEVTDKHQVSIDELIIDGRKMASDIESLNTVTNELDILSKSFKVSITQLEERVKFIEENGTGEGGGVIDPVIYEHVERLELQVNEMRLELDETKGKFQELDTKLNTDFMTLRDDMLRSVDIITTQINDLDTRLTNDVSTLKSRVNHLRGDYRYYLEYTRGDFVDYNPMEPAIIRRIGDTCILTGTMKCTKAGVVSPTNTVAIGKVEYGFRPAMSNVSAGRMQGSNNESWQLSITNTGEVRAGRMSRTSGNIANEWMPFTAVWFTDESVPE